MITLKIKDKSGAVLAETTHENYAQLVYEASYNEGDIIVLECTEKSSYIKLMLDDTMADTFAFLKDGTYNLTVPFGEACQGYCAKSFTGERHFLSARYATKHEIALRKNLAFNPFDNSKNATLFPHAIANVETRGEAVFAARNAINGNTANQGHGVWPFESWGIQRREDAEFVVEFGREVLVDGIGITIRCDFPHDNWWHTVTVEFSDGSTETLQLEKTCLPQSFNVAARKVLSAKLCHMKKDETDESPFPALTAIEYYGTEA